jgi:hypothetical protein
MADDALTATEFERWPTPLDVLAAAGTVFDSAHVKNIILERLRAGLITAVSPSVSQTIGDNSPALSSKLTVISGNYFEHIDDEEDFWRGGQLKSSVRQPRTGETITVRCFDIKLDPADIRNLLSGASIGPPERPDSVEVANAPSQKVPRITDGLLERWYELYKLAYQGTSHDTLKWLRVLPPPLTHCIT